MLGIEFGAEFWVAASLVVFVSLTIKPIGKFIIESLDKRSARIKAELKDALNLKEEAQSLLVSYQRKQQQAVEDSKEIVEHAKNKAKRILELADKEIEVEITKRTDLALQRIANVEAAVISGIRENAIDITISTARSLIVQNLNNDATDALLNEAVSGIGQKFH